ncbi:hypothetical protein PoB_000479800 [Plakobranchus ocellatus]|uniref:Uncharacterized protein n=1 Tax=Plakobranchus ocellatus TaxID=259542 RepID=A0AAV3Y7X2_9GAST|nr:hypothetical protein PoB_000479800 [Plakobranchus ocellatus]
MLTLAHHLEKVPRHDSHRQLNKTVAKPGAAGTPIETLRPAVKQCSTTNKFGDFAFRLLDAALDPEVNASVARQSDSTPERL